MKKIPELLLKGLRELKGFDEEPFLRAHELPAITSVRLHPLKHSSAFAAEEIVPWCSEGRYLGQRPVFTLDPFYHAGAYYVQEASSMFLQHVLKSVLPDNKNLRVLDLCAAPGGKSTLIASFLDRSSLLISNDVIRSRASILEENMARWGYMNAWVTSNDPRDFGKLEGYFDVIIVDAPCSGSGLFRKDAAALNEWSEGNVHLCSQRQQRIIADVWPALKKNGILVYATCSYSQEEDEAILDWMGTTFDAKGMRIGVPEEWNIVEASATQKEMYGYRFFPDNVRGEGFFIAVVQKQEETEELRYPKTKVANDRSIKEQAGYLLNVAYVRIVQNADKNFAAIMPEHYADLELLQKIVYFRKLGVELGTPSSKEWLPAHDIALSVDAALGLNYISVNKEQALRFLKKEDLSLPMAERGWHIIKYEGLGLGWVKSLGNRFNNYLPKNQRIRMDID